MTAPTVTFDRPTRRGFRQAWPQVFFGRGTVAATVWSQRRDVEEFNDNMTPAMEMRVAADMERWAASRANDPGFAPFCFVAVAQAQRTRRAHRPTAVRTDR